MNINSNLTVYGTIRGYDSTQVATADSTSESDLALSIKGGAYVGSLKVNDSEYIDGNLVGTESKSISGFGKVYLAVWNDLADAIDVPFGTELDYGYCYSYKNGEYHKSKKHEPAFGIHSDTAGFILGKNEHKQQINTAVAGFVLAYTDKEYENGTPLTTGKYGKLTKAGILYRIIHPENVIATFWKAEKAETWNGKVVDGRNWVKIK